MDVTEAPAGRALRVHDTTGDSDARMDMPHCGRYMKLVTPLSSTLPAWPDLRWANSLGEEGFVFDRGHLWTLIGNVGVMDGWAWLIVSDTESDVFAQTCGSPDSGLALELSAGGHMFLVMPDNGVPTPRFNIGRFNWLYQASAGELLQPREVAITITRWFRTSGAPSGYILRILDGRARWRRP